MHELTMAGSYGCQIIWPSPALSGFYTTKVSDLFYRLLIQIIDTYFPHFYYCSIMSAGSNFTCMSHLENQLYYHPLTLKIFEDFYHRLIGIPKDDKIKMLLHLGFP